MAQVELGSPAGRWTVAAAVLGSGAVFLESTVATVALPAIAREFRLDVEGLQWVMNGYLLPLSALILLGGSLGDRYRRRIVFVIGLVGFALGSIMCALASSFPMLVACRVVQGASGALVVPNSLAILDTAFPEEERAAAIGQWAGWSAVSTAVGPVLGGWLVDAASWRWVFAVVAPFGLAAAWIAARRMRDAEDTVRARRSIDYPGAVLVTVGLAGVTAALVSGPAAGGSPAIRAAGVLGLVSLLGFVLYERRARDPLLPLGLFRSRQFAGANLVTLLVYTALGGFFFFLVLELQDVLGYSALQAGAALLPINLLMLAVSSRAGRLSSRIGARLPLTAGAFLMAAGLLLLSRLHPGAAYATTVLPGLLVFGVGLGVLVTPLTAAVLGAVPDEQTGVASAVNNAVARLAGLLGTAALPLAAGLAGREVAAGAPLAAGYVQAMRIAAGLCVAGGLAAWVTVRDSGAAAVPMVHPSPTHGCVQRRRAMAVRTPVGAGSQQG